MIKVENETADRRSVWLDDSVDILANTIADYKIETTAWRNLNTFGKVTWLSGVAGDTLPLHDDYLQRIVVQGNSEYIVLHTAHAITEGQQRYQAQDN